MSRYLKIFFILNGFCDYSLSQEIGLGYQIEISLLLSCNFIFLHFTIGSLSESKAMIPRIRIWVRGWAAGRNLTRNAIESADKTSSSVKETWQNADFKSLLRLKKQWSHFETSFQN